MTLTKRQLEGLEAAFIFGTPYQSPFGGSAGGRHVRSMGGARRRMVDELCSSGYLARYDREREPKANALTAKGLRALIAELERRAVSKHQLPDFRAMAAERLAKAREALPAREAHEAALARRDEEERAAARARREEANARERTKKLARMRQIFADHGFAESIADWSEEKLLGFLEQCVDAEMLA